MCSNLCTLWEGEEFTGFVLPSSLDMLEYKNGEIQVSHTLHDVLEYGTWVFSKLTLLSQETLLPVLLVCKDIWNVAYNFEPRLVYLKKKQF